MDNSAPRGTPNSRGNASHDAPRNASLFASLADNAPLAQTIPGPTDTGNMARDFLHVILNVRSLEGQRRWRQIIQRVPRPQLASRDQTGFNSGMSSHGVQNYIADFDGMTDNDDNGDDAVMGLSSFENQNAGSDNAPRNTGFMTNQTFGTQLSPANNSYGQQGLITGTRFTPSPETDEEASSSDRASEYQPSSSPHAEYGNGSVTMGSAGSSQSRQQTPLLHPGRRGDFVVNSSRGFAASQRQTAGQSSRKAPARQDRAPNNSSDSGVNDSGMSIMGRSLRDIYGQNLGTPNSERYNMSGEAVPDPHLTLRGHEAPSATRGHRPAAGVSWRYNMAGRSLPQPSLALRGHDISSRRRQQRPPVGRRYNMPGTALSQPSLALRGHDISSGRRQQRPAAATSEARRPRQPPVRERYVPAWERSNASGNAVAESSRQAEPRIGRLRDSAHQSIEYTNSDPIKEDSYSEDNDAESEESNSVSPNAVPNTNMAADWRRSSEDAKTPHLKALGVVCEHVANCNTNSPFRKAISTFFGRNKKCIRDIPEEILVHFCRKHYQRCRFRDADNWTQKQCEMISETFDRIETWSNANRAAGRGAVVIHWNIQLRKRQAEAQAAKKKAAAAAAKKSKADPKGKGKAPVDSEEESEEDEDDYPTDGSPPRWMIPYISRNLSFRRLREVFARLRNECLAVKTNRLPDIEFLPVLEWIGGAKPAVVTYKKRAPAKQTPANKPATKGKAKAITPETDGEDEHYTEEEEYESTLSDSNELQSSPPRKRKRTTSADEVDEDEAEYLQNRVRRATQATPSQRHMYPQRPRSPVPDPAQATQRPPARQLYVPRHARPTYKDPTDKSAGGSK